MTRRAAYYFVEGLTFWQRRLRGEERSPVRGTPFSTSQTHLLPSRRTFDDSTLIEENSGKETTMMSNVPIAWDCHRVVVGRVVCSDKPEASDGLLASFQDLALELRRKTQWRRRICRLERQERVPGENIWRYRLVLAFWMLQIHVKFHFLIHVVSPGSSFHPSLHPSIHPP